jgi:hypothetical protein
MILLKASKQIARLHYLLRLISGTFLQNNECRSAFLRKKLYPGAAGSDTLSSLTYLCFVSQLNNNKDDALAGKPFPLKDQF